MTTPTLTAANTIRCARAKIRHDMKRGDVPIEQAINEPALQSMLLFDFLTSLPLAHLPIGDTGPRADRIAEPLHRSPLVRVRDLTQRERNLLVRNYRKYAPIKTPGVVGVWDLDTALGQGRR